MAFTRSAAGCFACKIKHKKCDETKPHCLRCQKSRIECPGYMYIQDPNNPNRKVRTLPAPRTAVGRSRATTLHTTPSTNIEGEPGPQLRCRSTRHEDPVTSQASYGTPGTSVDTNVGKLPGSICISNRLASSSSISGSPPSSSTDFHTSNEVVNAINPDPAQALPGMSMAIPMTSGQSSLMAALFSLGSSPDANLPPHRAQDSTNQSVPSVSSWALDDIDDVGSQENGDSEDGMPLIRRELVLDKRAMSNALPFVLQGYAAWVRRLAIEPLKLTRIGRDFVFSHFQDGDQSRWIIGLIANIGNRIGTVQMMEGYHQPMISALHWAVRRRLETVKSQSKLTKSELVQALDSALEVIAIHIYVDSPTEAMTLRQEALPIFQLLCPEPPGTPINLPSLLQHPLGCLRQYASMNVFFTVLTDMPTMFRYDVPISSSQLADPYLSSPAIQEDGLVQWLYGVPNQTMMLLAAMKTMHLNGLVPNEETVDSLEQDIRDVPPFTGSSSDRFLAIIRFVVQECWRQATFIYLYMAVCGDSSDTPRVEDALKRFMRLVNGTRPGRLPDEFLTSPLILISPAAQGSRDREVIRHRAMRFHRRGETHLTNNSLLDIIEHYWARADAEARPVVWSDVAVSRRQVLGI